MKPKGKKPRDDRKKSREKAKKKKLIHEISIIEHCETWECEADKQVALASHEKAKYYRKRRHKGWIMFGVDTALAVTIIVLIYLSLKATVPGF